MSDETTGAVRLSDIEETRKNPQERSERRHKEMITTGSEDRLSVRELIRVLRRCPDQDAFVVIPDDEGYADFFMIDGAWPRGQAIVEIVRGNKGWL